MTPFALWRSRLPASIGSWFARDLTRAALALADAGRVTLRSVEALEALGKTVIPMSYDVTLPIAKARGFSGYPELQESVPGQCPGIYA